MSKPLHGFNIEPENPHAFIQWKGTDVCMDFHCECGAHCHFDGYFAYAVRCPHCSTTYEMPHYLYPRKVCDETNAHWRDNPQILGRDENISTGEDDDG